MLSIIACYSTYVAVPVLAVTPNERPLGRRFPRFHPRLWVFAALIVLLAVDFAMIPLVDNPASGLRLYAADAAVILVPLLLGTFIRLTIWDLGCLAIIMGLLGMLSLPGITVR